MGSQEKTRQQLLEDLAALQRWQADLAGRSAEHQSLPESPASKAEIAEMQERERKAQHHRRHQSRLLLGAFEAKRPLRHHTLAYLLKRRNRKNVVLVMMVNHGYIDMFLNWVRSCEKHGIDARPWALVFTVDAEAEQIVEQLGFTAYTDEQSYGKQSKQAPRKFGDGTFRRLMFQKTAVVHDVLQLGYDVLFQDIDVVWQQDPFEYLMQPSLQAFDALFMYDGPNRRFKPLHANSGFFLLRNTPFVRQFWGTVLSNYYMILKYGSQQQVVNHVLVSHSYKGLKPTILPEEDFANGHLFNVGRPSRLPQNPYVIHCSWTGNHDDKIEKYKQVDLWYSAT